MITESYLNKEIDLAKKIFIYYIDKTINYLSVGSDRYTQWYIDSLQLYVLLNYLLEVRIEDNTPYCGAEEASESLLLKTFRKVREYYTIDIDTAYSFTEVSVPVIPSYRQPFVADWKSITFIITEDDITSLDLGVDLEAISDMESIQLVVNGLSDPNYNTNTEVNGYHIVGSTLYWHNYYNLKTGDTVRIQYLQIAG
jgi:hypothetical protein